jgi:hypothetical protein
VAGGGLDRDHGVLVAAARLAVPAAEEVQLRREEVGVDLRAELGDERHRREVDHVGDGVVAAAAEATSAAIA